MACPHQSYAKLLREKNISKQNTACHYVDKRGKILGSGGGGFFVFYCDENNQEKLIKNLSGLNELKFQLSHSGSEIIYTD